MAQSNGINRTRLADNFGVLLKDKALHWYWDYREHVKEFSWMDLRDAMVQRFRIRRTDNDVRQSLEKRKKDPRKENFLDFYHAIMNMTLALVTPLSEQELIHLLIRNMRGGLQAFLAGQSFTDIYTLVNKCIAVEDTWRRIAWNPEVNHQQFPKNNINELGMVEDYQGKSPYSDISELGRYSNNVCSISSAKNLTQPPTNYNPSSKLHHTPASNVCWNCLAPGHFYQNCTSLTRNIFCFGCGVRNVFKPQCPNCRSTTENSKRDVRNTGTLRSQTHQTQPRPTVQELSRNTDAFTTTQPTE